ncbi:MAG: ParA family protein [Magnetospirillum sp.]|nr:ParA family protein [Magnetospirillum sp.]
MAVLTVASTKGGVGKSMTVTNIAIMAYQAGAKVAVFDCDPQRHSELMIARYLDALGQAQAGRASLDVWTDATQDDLLDRANAAANNYDLVLIDLQGSANQLMLLAIVAADLVILPVQPAALDIDGAVIAWTNVRKAAQIARREIPARVFFTRTPAAIQPRVLKQTRANFEQKGLKVMRTEFVERSAFKEATFDGRFPTEFAPQSPAADNVRAIYTEIMETLHTIARAEAV